MPFFIIIYLLIVVNRGTPLFSNQRKNDMHGYTPVNVYVDVEPKSTHSEWWSFSRQVSPSLSRSMQSLSCRVCKHWLINNPSSIHNPTLAQCKATLKASVFTLLSSKKPHQHPFYNQNIDKETQIYPNIVQYILMKTRHCSLPFSRKVFFSVHVHGSTV